MKKLKRVLLYIPINLYLKVVVSESFRIDTILFNSRHHVKILEHYKDVKYWYMSKQ